MLHKVNRNLFRRLLIQPIRYIHGEQTAKALYPLECRKLLRVGGQDASVFLQGLITNDMRHLDDGTNSMYAMFLNNKGRVLYDTLIYKWDQDDSYMIECDKNVITLLQKYLKMFKLKRIVDIIDASQEFKLHALISTTESDFKILSKRNIHIYKDPRIVDLGCRIISSASLKEHEIAEVFGNVKINHDSEEYRYLRYKLGVSEGAEDLPPGSSFPLEANCDYLHGVSFHKGCYIGQELTARVHHTGVVRKRIMPIKFTEQIDKNLEKDAVISATNNPKSNLGKLRGSVGDYGLGLVRIKEALEAKTLTIGKYSGEIVKPTWWPLEAPKEKATIVKSE